MLIARDTEFDYYRSDGGATVTVSQEDEGDGPMMITVVLDDMELDQVVLRFKYTLKIPADHQINRITPSWVELNIDSFWLPFFSSFPKFNYVVRLELDDTFEVITGDHKDDWAGTMVLRSRFPRRDIPFCAAPAFSATKGEYVDVFSGNDDTPLDSIAHFADQAILFYKSFINEPADFEVARYVVVSPRKDVGYSRKNYIVLSKIQGIEPQRLSAFLAHEFAHYWFSDALLSSEHHWLTESFAEYLSNIYIREAFGQEAFDKEMADKRERIKEEPKSLADFDSRPSYLAMYHKGPLVLAGFEEHIGQEAFQKFINDFILRNIRTNEQLFDMIHQTLGPEALAKMKELRAEI